MRHNEQTLGNTSAKHATEDGVMHGLATLSVLRVKRQSEHSGKSVNLYDSEKNAFKMSAQQTARMKKKVK